MSMQSIANRIKSERRDVTVQTSLSPADAVRLDQLVEWLIAHGAPTNRSSAIRALIVDSLDAFDER